MPTSRVRPRKADHGPTRATAPSEASEPHYPGDQVEMRVSAEVPGPKGGGAWVTAGLQSIHRPDESSQQCDERVFGWVAETLANLQQEAGR